MEYHWIRTDDGPDSNAAARELTTAGSRLGRADCGSPVVVVVVVVGAEESASPPEVRAWESPNVALSGVSLDAFVSVVVRDLSCNRGRSPEATVEDDGP